MGHPGPRAGSPEEGWPGWPWDPSPKPALKREERMPTGGRHHRAGAALQCVMLVTPAVESGNCDLCHSVKEAGFVA